MVSGNECQKYGYQVSFQTISAGPSEEQATHF